jgi:hypothetical protein
MASDQDVDQLIERLRGECRCGCRSGGCDRPEGCQCGPNCPCSSLTPQNLHQAADEIERLTELEAQACALVADRNAEIKRLRIALQRALDSLDER